jgi:hypothetical protein
MRHYNYTTLPLPLPHSANNEDFRLNASTAEHDKATAHPRQPPSTSFWTGVCFITFCAATALLYATRAWYLLGVAPIGPERPPFSDAHAQLITADACLLGGGTWIERVCFMPSADVLPHAQSYEPWLTFSRLGLRHEHHVAISWVVIVLFYLAVCLLFKPATWRQAGLLTVIVFSSAVQFAVERANFDLVMSTLLIASGWLLSRRHLAASLLACVLLGFSTTLKIYSGLGTLFAWLATNSRRRIPVVCASTAACLLAIAVLGVDNILVLGEGAPEGATRFSTGAHLTVHRYGFAGTALIVAASLSICGWLLRPPALSRIRTGEPETAVFLVAWLTAIPLFFLKDSYDYRLVLWLPMLALGAQLARDTEGSTGLSRVGQMIVASFITVASVELVCNLLQVTLPASVFRHTENLLILVKHAGIWTFVGISSAVFFCIVRSKRILQ